MSHSCLSGIFAWGKRSDYPLVGGEAGPRGRASSNFGPEVGFNLVSGVLATSPRFFSRVKLQSDRRVLRDLFQSGATQPGFSTSNSTYVLLKNQG